jgi:uncharacterized RDD family membrane protein YckC
LTRPSAPPPYAGFVTRTVALVTDVVIADAIAVTVAAVGGLVLSTIIPGKQSLDLPTALAAGAAWVVFVGGYFVGFWTLLGRTPGMRLLGLELSTSGGERVGTTRALARLGGMVLAAIPLGAGYLLSLVDDRRQGLHDKVAGTLVLYAGPGHRAAVASAAAEPAKPAAAAQEAASLPHDATPA